MSGYRDGDTIEHANDYLRNGGDPEKAAAYLQCTVEELPQLLGLPQWKQAVPAADAEFDLWRSDELDGVL